MIAIICKFENAWVVKFYIYDPTIKFINNVHKKQVHMAEAGTA